ncbi:TlpA family protein disulfide reductase [bacterium]|nr:MAG: TlpA family protein disulfide reductase [bacterium]
MRGRMIALDDYRGKVVLLQFWATWCPPCVQSIPEIRSLYNRYHARDFEVVGISGDEDKKALDSFTQKHRMKWPQIVDSETGPRSLSDSYVAGGIPYLLLIGKDGNLAAVNPAKNQLEKAIQMALAK